MTENDDLVMSAMARGHTFRLDTINVRMLADGGLWTAHLGLK